MNILGVPKTQTVLYYCRRKHVRIVFGIYYYIQFPRRPPGFKGSEPLLQLEASLNTEGI
jgi:hypothetical protein